MSGSGFFHELKRRHVYKVGAAYLVVGWLVIQIADTVLPAFDAPSWVMRAVIGVVALFFPVALVLSWVFDLTSAGVRRTLPEEEEEASGAPEPVPWGGRALTYVILVLFAAAVGVTGWRLVGSARGSANVAAPRSVAVLPFDDLGGDSSNAYFATGMQDMILTQLVGIGDLKVISRTSTELYGSQPENLSLVGQELGVATLLRGSVQRSGSNVLINVQLIDASTDEHLWAASYTRTLDDVFGVEGEVAQKVAEALQATLTPAERQRVAVPPTTDAAAYDLYLQADAHARRAQDNNALVRTEMPRAIPLYEQALASDPGFALALAALADAHMRLYWYGPDRTEARLTAARTTADRALALEPELGEAHLALALYDYWGHRDYAPALEKLERARSAMPNSAEVQFFLASIARRKGEWERAIAAFRQAALLDPRSPQILVQLARTFQWLRRYAEADSAYARAAIVGQDRGYDPGSAAAWNALYWKGDLTPVRDALAALTPGTDRYEAYASGFWQEAWYSRNFEAAMETAATSTALDWATPGNVVLPRILYLAWAQEAAGEGTRARENYADVQSRMVEALRERPDDPNLHLALGFAAAGLGLQDEAVTAGTRAEELMPPSRDAVTGGDLQAWRAKLDVRAGLNKQALERIERLMTMPVGLSVSPGLLRLDPVWDPIRNEPSFKALAR